MAFLTIAGITVSMAEFAEREPERIGSESRAYAGNLRSTVRDEKRSFDGTTRLMTAADVATLRAAIANGVFVTVNGDAVENVAMTCTVAIAGKPWQKIAGGGKAALSLTIRET